MFSRPKTDGHLIKEMPFVVVNLIHYLYLLAVICLYNYLVLFIRSWKCWRVTKNLSKQGF